MTLMEASLFQCFSKAAFVRESCEVLPYAVCSQTAATHPGYENSVPNSGNARHKSVMSVLASFYTVLKTGSDFAIYPSIYLTNKLSSSFFFY